MKKSISVLLLLMALIGGSLNFVNAKNLNPISSTLNIIVTDWVEYVLIGEQWYKVTYYDDGHVTYQAVAIAGE